MNISNPNNSIIAWYTLLWIYIQIDIVVYRADIVARNYNHDNKMFKSIENINSINFSVLSIV